MSRYDEKDAAKDTGVSIKEVSSAWHQARDDAAKEGGHGVPADRHGESSKSSSHDSNDQGSGDSGK